jgi:hypothetical protein
MTSLSNNARVAGLLYILSSVFGSLSLVYIPNVLIVKESASVTAGNLVSHELLFRTGIVSYLLCSALWIFVTWALYRLLKGVDHTLAALMVIGTLLVIPIFFVNAANDVAALLFARGADFLSVFDKAQREALVVLFLNLHHQVDLAQGILWGLWFMPVGLLVYRSRFLPRFLGAWLIVAGFAYWAMSFTGLLFPVYEDKVWRFAQPVLLAEVAFMLWLTVVSAKEQRVAEASA